MDTRNNLDAIKFRNIIKSFNLQQHVRQPTHKHGHTLDLLITRTDDDIVTRVEIKDPMLSDHSAIHCKLRLKKPSPEQVNIHYRKLGSIDIDRFKDDLQNSNLLLDDHTDLPLLIDMYEKTLRNTLDSHAPIKQRLITPRPSSAWYNDDIMEAKKQRRKLERRWRSSRLCVDREMYAEQCKIVNNLLKDAKTTYYSAIISENICLTKKCFLIQSTNCYT